MSVPSAPIVLLVLVLSGLWPAGGDDARSVTLTARPLDAAGTAPVIADLHDGDVLRVRVEHGPSGEAGTVSQCPRRPGYPTRCTNTFPVLFDDHGIAIFQYQVRDAGGCDHRASCTMVVEAFGSERVAYAYLVFGGPAPAATTATLSPAGPVAPGAAVTVRVGPLAPGTAVEVAFCAETCRAVAGVEAAADGFAAATIVTGDRCGRCGYRVVAGPSESFLPVRFVAAPAPSHSPLRVAIGLTAAALLLGVAALLVVAVDWRPPSEAATPEMEEP